MVVWGSTLALSALCLSWTPPAFFSWLSCPEHIQRTSPLSNPASTPEPEQVRRVAIIGAGTAGLTALKTFVHDTPKPAGQRWEIQVFEQRNDLGGTW